VRDDERPGLPTGEIGGIEVKGPNVFKGYWRMPEKTRKSSPPTAGSRPATSAVDERGYVTIVGRSKDLIISGGYNVYPAEIEGYLNEMPGVAESAVVGVPHPDFGEVGVAIVIAKAGARSMPTACRWTLKSQLANFKIPKRCFVVTNCRATPWARCRRRCCAPSTRGCSPKRQASALLALAAFDTREQIAASTAAGEGGELHAKAAMRPSAGTRARVGCPEIALSSRQAAQ
jgi:malonyl-CoA/methylmalonyl-CoA synthetase